MKKLHGAHTKFLPFLINEPIGKTKLMQTIFPKSTNYHSFLVHLFIPVSDNFFVTELKLPSKGNLT
jgi:hypothetical protein